MGFKGDRRRGGRGGDPVPVAGPRPQQQPRHPGGGLRQARRRPGAGLRAQPSLPVSSTAGAGRPTTRAATSAASSVRRSSSSAIMHKAVSQGLSNPLQAQPARRHRHRPRHHRLRALDQGHLLAGQAVPIARPRQGRPAHVADHADRSVAAGTYQGEQLVAAARPAADRPHNGIDSTQPGGFLVRHRKPTDVRVRVLNGAGTTGLAASVSTDLRASAFNVVDSGDADNFNYARSVVRHRPEQPAKGQLLQRALAQRRPARARRTLAGCRRRPGGRSDYAGVQAWRVGDPGTTVATTTTTIARPEPVPQVEGRPDPAAGLRMSEHRSAKRTGAHVRALVLAGGEGTRLRPDHPHEREAARARGQQAHPLLRPRAHRRGGDQARSGSSSATRATRSGRRWATARGGGSRSPTSRRTQPLGLAHCVLIARDFLGDEDFVMYLGDNLLASRCEVARRRLRSESRARPRRRSCSPGCPTRERFGVADLGPDGEVVGLVEKPREPPSDLALVGVYLFDATVHEAVRALEPSARGELEITEAIQWLIDHGHRVRHQVLEGYWKDTGELDALLEGNRLVLETFEPRIDGTVDDALEDPRPRRGARGSDGRRLHRSAGPPSSARARASRTASSGRSRRSTTAARSSAPRSSTPWSSSRAASSTCRASRTR